MARECFLTLLSSSGCLVVCSLGSDQQTGENYELVLLDLNVQYETIPQLKEGNQQRKQRIFVAKCNYANKSCLFPTYNCNCYCILSELYFMIHVLSQQGGPVPSIQEKNSALLQNGALQSLSFEHFHFHTASGKSQLYNDCICKIGLI